MSYRQFIMAEKNEATTIEWLRSSFLPAIVSKMNCPQYQRVLALYDGDRIPENERNLTDTRNRVSLIIEYNLAMLSNVLMSENGIDDLFCSSVVANRFPDLEFHDNTGKKGIRIEVKCIESIAEEKSANFDTLIKDIKQRTDYVVVFLWEWDNDNSTVKWDRAPLILDSFVFHARSLAQLRDQTWLNAPPSNAKGYQGFDIRNAVVCNEKGEYSIEEGNYGKLLRIWKLGDSYHSFGQKHMIQDTITEFDRFKNKTIKEGFYHICNHNLSEIVKKEAIPIRDPLHCGFIIGNIVVLLSAQGLSGVRDRYNDSEILRIMEKYGVNIIVRMNDKYRSTLYVNNGSLEKVINNEKPKKLYSVLNQI